jgi:hypothetical protein
MCLQSPMYVNVGEAILLDLLTIVRRLPRDDGRDPKDAEPTNPGT